MLIDACAVKPKAWKINPVTVDTIVTIMVAIMFSRTLFIVLLGLIVPELITIADHTSSQQEYTIPLYIVKCIKRASYKANLDILFYNYHSNHRLLSKIRLYKKNR